MANNPFRVLQKTPFRELENNPNWEEYATKSQRYIDAYSERYSREVPFTGQMLAGEAKKAFSSSGVLVPASLALAQGQFETDIGSRGRNPLTNPWNVGEFDRGTELRFKTTQEGMAAYFKLMTEKYLKGVDVEDLLGNFVNLEGNRYASDPDYEKKIRGQRDYIEKFWKKNAL